MYYYYEYIETYHTIKPGKELAHFYDTHIGNRNVCLVRNKKDIYMDTSRCIVQSLIVYYYIKQNHLLHVSQCCENVFDVT